MPPRRHRPSTGRGHLDQGTWVQTPWLHDSAGGGPALRMPLLERRRQCGVYQGLQSGHSLGDMLPPAAKLIHSGPHPAPALCAPPSQPAAARPPSRLAWSIVEQSEPCHRHRPGNRTPGCVHTAPEAPPTRHLPSVSRQRSCFCRAGISTRVCSQAD